MLGGRYVLGRAMGTGVTGTVYGADDRQLGRQVAVKVLHEALAGDPVFVQKFYAEARTVATLQHPNVLTIYDWGVDGSAYLVTEYLAGGSLRSLLDSGRTLSHSQALILGLEVCKALDYMHRSEIVHRDLKPANLLFSQDGHLKVSDFGLAAALAETSRTDIFVEGIVGTARFSSPEQAKGQLVDGRSDVYALALVLIEAVTGHVPFVEETLLGTLRARRRRDLPVPASMGPLGPAVAKAGSVDRSARPFADGFAKLLLQVSPALSRPEPLPLVGPGEVGAAPLSGEVPVIPKSKPLEERESTRTIGPTRRAPWVLVAAMIFVGSCLGGLALWEYSRESILRVPLLIGVEETEAVSIIVESGWAVEPRYERRDGTREGQVLATEPVFGYELPANETVVLVVSLGPPRVSVPTGLIGLTRDEAERLLESADLNVGRIVERYDERLALGIILEVAVLGDELAPGSDVDLVVSAGPAPRVIPVGLKEAPAIEALQALSALGLQPTILETYNEFVPAGDVVSLNPGPDVEIASGSLIEVVVSIGPIPRPVPDVIGLRLAAAEELLAAGGFRIVEVLGPERDGEISIVLSQDPVAGEEVSPSSRVVLFLESNQLLDVENDEEGTSE